MIGRTLGGATVAMTQGVIIFSCHLVRLNPLLHRVGGMRVSLINVEHFGFMLDFTVLAVVTGPCIALSAYLFNKIEA